MRKGQSRRKVSSENRPCRECKRIVPNVDVDAKSVLCWRCVAKTLNSGSVILSDLTREEFAQYLKKDKKK
jgi:hypothetical protein